MKLLIDAHTLLWAIDEPSRLGSVVAATMPRLDTERFISAGTIWEFAIKVGLNKLKLSQPFRPWITQAISDLAIDILPITIDVADIQAKLPHHHGDPFDRILVAHAKLEGATIASIDGKLDQYGITRIW